MKNLASLAILLLCATTLSAQSKQRIAVLPSVGDLEPQGLILLTDKVREIATKNLPMEKFNILKQDVITKMIGEEELYRACKEGVCIGDLARKTNANYGARCDVIMFNNSLVLKFELYSVNEDAIFETFTDYEVKDFRGMLALLETRLPEVFQKMARVSKPEPPTPMPPMPAPLPPQTYTPPPPLELPKPLLPPTEPPKPLLPPEAPKANTVIDHYEKPGSARKEMEKQKRQMEKQKRQSESKYDKSMDFTTGERWGTWALNIVPGLGSAVIMKDHEGAGVNAAAGFGGIALVLIGAEIDNGGTSTLGIILWIPVGSIWNIYRSITYHHPNAVKKSAANALQGVNFAVLPDQDGNIKGYVAYRMEF